jgi:hypothetical protein
MKSPERNQKIIILFIITYKIHSKIPDLFSQKLPLTNGIYHTKMVQ